MWYKELGAVNEFFYEEATMIRLLGCVMLMVVVLPCKAVAHPHVYIENSLRIMFDDAGMTGIQARWMFDEMFSSTLIEEYDSNNDGKFALKEVESLRQGAFSNLKNYHYFTYITIGEKVFEVKYVKDFQATIQNHRIIYMFFIPCHVKAGPVPKKITISMYDETYYTDFLLANYQCDHSAAPGIVISSIKEIENFDKSFYFGQIAPVELMVTFKK